MEDFKSFIEDYYEDIFFVILLLASILGTVFVALFRPFPLYISLLFGLFSFMGPFFVRYAEPLARFSLHWFLFWNAKDKDEGDPSDLSVYSNVFAAFILMVPQICLLFLNI
ncbi:MAG: hypothetical protein LKJ88_03205 [Bacilli bacterium]|jgi:hypothetical protein|nr:hypothetical protein [Bacilli bacterium]